MSTHSLVPMSLPPLLPLTSYSPLYINYCILNNYTTSPVFGLEQLSIDGHPTPILEGRGPSPDTAYSRGKALTDQWRIQKNVKGGTNHHTWAAQLPRTPQASPVIGVRGRASPRNFEN